MILIKALLIIVIVWLSFNSITSRTVPFSVLLLYTVHLQLHVLFSVVICGFGPQNVFYRVDTVWFSDGFQCKRKGQLSNLLVQCAFLHFHHLPGIVTLKTFAVLSPEPVTSFVPSLEEMQNIFKNTMNNKQFFYNITATFRHAWPVIRTFEINISNNGMNISKSNRISYRPLNIFSKTIIKLKLNWMKICAS